MEREVTIRPAKVDDAPIIAQAIALAIGDPIGLSAYCGEEYLAVLTEIARTRRTQYCWQNSIIAEVDGVAAGVVVGYDGAQLEVLREGTLAVIREQTGRVPVMTDETEAGEYYLDCVAVFEQFRGCSIGRKLIDVLCRKASEKGIEKVGLLVDFDNPRAERLYAKMGFERVGERLFFGHRMYHLQRVVNRNIIQKNR